MLRVGYCKHVRVWLPVAGLRGKWGLFGLLLVLLLLVFFLGVWEALGENRGNGFQKRTYWDEDL